MRTSDNFTALYNRLGYTFEEPENLKLALTHRSAAKQHNERLEFLGDAVLGMIIAEELYKRFPKQPEGNLTRMRSALVKGETLAEMAIEFDLGQRLRLGPGEMKSGGHRRSSILADVVEAIIGAIYLEAGLATCESLVLKWFSARIDKLDPDNVMKDNKTRLQEYLQGRKQPLPQYEVVEVAGKDHNQTFRVSCTVDALPKPIIGKGTSRRKAEQEAASKTLEQLTNG